MVCLLIEIPAALAAEGDYSFVRQSISHLGMTGCGQWGDSEPPLEVCSPAHPLVNGVFILSGSMLAMIAFVWHDWISPTALGRCGSFLLAAGGILAAGTGRVPGGIGPTCDAVVGSGAAGV